MLNDRLNERLFEAVENENLKVVDFLLDIEADVFSVKNDKTLLEVAREKGNPLIVKKIEDKIIEVFSKDVTEGNNYEMIKVLGRFRGGEVLVSEMRSFELGDKLVAAISNGKLVEALKLIDEGADVNFANHYGNTPIRAACYQGKGFAKVIDWLVKRGARFDEQDFNGNTPLLVAADRGDYRIIDLLLSHGARVNVKNKEGKTPLWYATYYNRVEGIKTFLDKGAEVNVADINGITPLMNVADNSNVEMVKLLIEKGADIEAKNNNGKSVVRFSGNSKVKKVLLEAIKEKRLKEGVKVKENIFSKIFGFGR